MCSRSVGRAGLAVLAGVAVLAGCGAAVGWLMWSPGVQYQRGQLASGLGAVRGGREASDARR